MNKKVYLVGVGGIGSTLAEILTRSCRTLNNLHNITLILIDGDTVENSNLARQKFEIADLDKNKAAVLRRYLELFKPDNLTIRSVEDFVTKKNIGEIFEEFSENDIVITALDSTLPRKLIADYFDQFQTFTLINPGNELTDGSVQVAIKQNGEHISPNINNILHPEIFAAKKERKKAGCEVLAISNQQLVTTNTYVATLTAQIVFDLIKFDPTMNEIEDLKLPAEIYFDLKSFTMKMISVEDLKKKLELFSK